MGIEPSVFNEREVAVRGIRDAGPAERAALIETHVCWRIAQVLNRKVETVTLDAALANMGFNSVTMVEFVREFEEDFHVHLYPPDILDALSLRDVAEYLTRVIEDSQDAR